MKYKFLFYNTKEKTFKWYNDDYDWEFSLEGMFYQYFQGNYSCDCNRSLFFYNWDKKKELNCNGDKNIIELVKIKDENDKIIYIKRFNKHYTYCNNCKELFENECNESYTKCFDCEYVFKKTKQKEK